ncbi:MAG: DUF4097 domain-containing protein [Spirochaetaceae bacterium]|jgi:DUF4097 and DUF4098 domain-containing protein YvlB|nr:DUF4097 domain-containing protein [Spirochaetaceae bacterium]
MIKRILKIHKIALTHCEGSVFRELAASRTAADLRSGTFVPPSPKGYTTAASKKQPGQFFQTFRAAPGLLILFLVLAGALRGYALEDLSLVNTQSISLEGIDTLSLSYGDDEVILRESGTGDLIIKEYMKIDRSQYYADISRSAGTVSIRRGRRPWLYWSWKARAEIYLPASFRENIRISNSSGIFRAEIDLLDYKTIDINNSSGAVSLNRLSAETLSIRLSSGDLDIRSAEGNSFISLSSGRLQIGGLSGSEHRLKTSSGRMRIDTIQGTSVIELSSGGIVIEDLTGNADMEIKSGTLQITTLTGTTHRFKSSSGRTIIEKAQGRIEGEVSSGSLSIENFSGEGSFGLSSGNLTLYTEELTGDLRFRLSSGHIILNIPRNIPFNLDAITNSGKVQVTEAGAEAVQVSGNSTVLRPFGPSPERTIYARTNSGNVIINRR